MPSSSQRTLATLLDDELFVRSLIPLTVDGGRSDEPLDMIDIGRPCAFIMRCAESAESRAGACGCPTSAEPAEDAFDTLRMVEVAEAGVSRIVEGNPSPRTDCFLRPSVLVSRKGGWGLACVLSAPASKLLLE